MFRAGYQELSGSRRRSAATPERRRRREFGGVENVQRAMQRARTQEVTRLEHGLTFLATTASTAPFIGLFGTVWGIMNAFMGLSTTTSSSIQAVAPGIAEALIATAVGLAAAIPAVVMYNRFARQLRVLTAEMDTFGAEFLNIAERHFLEEVSAWPSTAYSEGSGSISEINVTPLVDVMLVLLVIFMVTAPILQQGVAIDLPKVAAGAARRRGGAARRQRRRRPARST